MLKIFVGDEQFYYALLLAYGTKPEGCSLKKVAKIMATFEREFKSQPSGILRHFGDDVKDQDNLTGLSWKEIITISRDTFNKGFKEIGVTYKPEEEFNRIKNGRDEFKGKYYCRVKTFNKNRTFYYRNHALVNSVIKAFLENQGTQELGLSK